MKRWMVAVLALVVTAVLFTLGYFGVSAGVAWLIAPSRLPATLAVIGYAAVVLLMHILADMMRRGWRQREQNRLHHKREQTYEALLHKWLSTLNSPFRSGVMGDEDAELDLLETRLWLLASPAVVKRYREFRAVVAERDSSNEQLKAALSNLVRSMRRDLGQVDVGALSPLPHDPRPQAVVPGMPKSAPAARELHPLRH